MVAYLPVYCASCAHASLSPAEKGEEHLLCTFCESLARVVPGPIYGDGDWLAFAEIDRAVFEAEVHGVEASSLAEEVQNALSAHEAPVAVVERMIRRVPSLANARPALVNRLPRGLRMLTTLLLARSRDAAPQIAEYSRDIAGTQDPP